MIEICKLNDTIQLLMPETATIVQVEEDYEALKKLLVKQKKSIEFTIDLTKVTQIDTAYIQLIIALIRECLPNQICIKGESQVVTDIFNLYGLSLSSSKV